MIKLNKKVEYALMAIKHMASKAHGELSTTREICDTLNTPFDTTAKVLQILNLAGHVKSVQGVKGGYTLSCNLEQMSFHELEECIEGKIAAVNCLSGDKNCEQLSSCNIIGPVKKLDQKVTEFLSSLKLSELLDVQTKHPQQEIEL